MIFQQLILPLTLPTDSKINSFIVGDSNWEAFSWVNRWPEWPIKPLAIHGEPGSGKTHLAQYFQIKSNAYWILPEDLTKKPDLLLQKGSAFIVDNYDQIQDENWLFHFYNLTKEQNFDALYCGRQSPAHSLFTLPDLKSRLRSMLSITIEQPDEELLKRIFKQRLESLGVFLPHDFDDICYYVLNRIERSYLMLDSIISRINEFLLREQRAFSLPLVREILAQKSIY